MRLRAAVEARPALAPLLPPPNENLRDLAADIRHCIGAEVQTHMLATRDVLF